MTDYRFTEQWDALDPFDESYPHLWIKAEHLGRYLFASSYLAARNARTVADIGCGSGYGSRELAKVVERVIAFDRSPGVLDGEVAISTDGSIEFLEFEIGRERLSIPGERGPVDAAVCFEVLEHLNDPGRVLRELGDILEPGGTLIISVPNGLAERTSSDGLLSNRLHRRVFSITGIIEMIDSAGFAVLETLGQPIAAEINRNETRLIRRSQTSGRIGDESALHTPEMIRRLAMVVAYPEQRDIERSYSVIVVAERREDRPERAEASG